MDFDPKKMAEEIVKGLNVSYYDLCCRKNMHKMYHAMKVPCPCKRVQARVRNEQLGEKIAAIMLHAPRFPRLEDIISVRPLTEEEIKKHEEEEKNK
jgi:hypothetical protein